LRFQMATEGGWDVGCFAACLIAAGLIASGAPSAIAILLGLPALAAAAMLLWQYYSPSQEFAPPAE
jgi:MFS transporter, DHA1 family, inner membrane transport protein